MVTSVLLHGKHINIYNYYLNNHRIKVGNCIKDLNVMFQDDLKFNVTH